MCPVLSLQFGVLLLFICACANADDFDLSPLIIGVKSNRPIRTRCRRDGGCSPVRKFSVYSDSSTGVVNGLTVTCSPDSDIEYPSKKNGHFYSKRKETFSCESGLMAGIIVEKSKATHEIQQLRPVCVIGGCNVVNAQPHGPSSMSKEFLCPKGHVVSGINVYKENDPEKFEKLGYDTVKFTCCQMSPAASAQVSKSMSNITFPLQKTDFDTGPEEPLPLDCILERGYVPIPRTISGGNSSCPLPPNCGPTKYYEKLELIPPKTGLPAHWDARFAVNLKRRFIASLTDPRREWGVREGFENLKKVFPPAAAGFKVGRSFGLDPDSIVGHQSGPLCGQKLVQLTVHCCDYLVYHTGIVVGVK